MADTLKTNKAKMNQVRNLVILTGIVLVGFIVFTYMMPDNTSQELNRTDEKINFANPLEHVDAESVILERTQKQLHDAEKKTDDLQKQINTILDAKKSEEPKSDVTQELKNRIEMLEKQLSASSQNPSSNMLPQNEMIAGSREFQSDLLPVQAGSGVSPNATYNNIRGEGIREDNLSLAPSEFDLLERKPLKNPNTYVPAGTYVKAVMLSGANASAAVTSSHNPNPMVFRITSQGSLPNQRKSHLKDCRVIASVVGDISSERGEITLETLSCTFPNDEVVDQKVQGWVFGGDGIFGVRGNPVWREGALLSRAFAAGTLSGFSSGLSQTYTSNSISAEGSVQTVNPGKFLQYGLAKGTSKSMDKLADYNIQRAEQYHPVIQISPGDEVDIVFKEGFFLDGKKHESRDADTSGNQSPVNSSPNLFPEPTHSTNNQEAQTLPLSPEDVRRIQEKSKELGLRVTNQSDAH